MGGPGIGIGPEWAATGLGLGADAIRADSREFSTRYHQENGINNGVRCEDFTNLCESPRRQRSIEKTSLKGFNQFEVFRPCEVEEFLSPLSSCLTVAANVVKVEPANVALTAVRKTTAHVRRVTVLLGTVPAFVSHHVTAQSKLVIPTEPAFLSSMVSPVHTNILYLGNVNIQLQHRIPHCRIGHRST
ncbi:hypothetical protein HOLleu_10287 [Holothuria leucospilota]|uniref:Uncharacterized protein n=1 Tax=Holothuria leucospilota TaxID=206669 RepID=A0A9Q1CE34_HOLLE|nr:hypothetical protein HOLleu_10287 [Holothuria leucospilota]